MGFRISGALWGLQEAYSTDSEYWEDLREDVRGIVGELQGDL